MGLKSYILKRTLLMIPTFFALTIITFFISRLAPGGPLKYFILGPESQISMESYLILSHKYGFDKPLWVQYVTWIKNIFLGDFGTSYANYQPVTLLMAKRIIPTLVLTSTSFFLSLIISIPLGIICALKNNSYIDFFARITTLIGMSMPSFWEGLLLIYFFALYLGWFPTLGYQTITSINPTTWESMKDIAWHLFLPALTLATGSLVLVTRLVRSTMLDVLRQDYIMTARAKGLKERIVILKHALRNVLLPVVTIIGLRIGFLLSGAVIVETMFAWPGLGTLMIEAVYSRDYPIIMGITMLVGIMVMIANLFTDIIYAYLDPRIRY